MEKIRQKIDLPTGPAGSEEIWTVEVRDGQLIHPNNLPSIFWKGLTASQMVLSNKPSGASDQ